MAITTTMIGALAAGSGIVNIRGDLARGESKLYGSAGKCYYVIKASGLPLRVGSDAVEEGALLDGPLKFETVNYIRQSFSTTLVEMDIRRL